MTKRRIYRSEQEWLQIITESRQSGLTDHAWCELHNISNSSFYNAATRLRKKACQIPEPEKTSYVLDFTSHQEVVKIDIIPSPLLSDFGCMPLLPPYSFLLCPRNIHGTRNDGFRTYTLGSHASRIS